MMRFVVLLLVLSASFMAGVYAQISEVERLALGRAAYERESYLEALDYVRTAIKNNPSYGDAHRYLAKIHYAMGEYRQAASAAQNALRYNRQDTRSTILLANSFRELREYRRAEELYRSTLRQFPAMAEAHRELGVLYLRENRFSLAFQSLQRALRYDGDDWQNVVAIGEYHQARGRHSEAEASFTRALRMEPRRREPYLALGRFYFQTGRYDRAIQVLSGGVDLFDHFVSGREVLGDAFLALGQFPQALAQFEWLERERAYHQPQEQALLSYKMALAHGGQNQQRAIEYYQKALRLSPNNDLYRFGYQRFIQSQEGIESEWRAQEARHMYNEAQRARRNGNLQLYLVSLMQVLRLDPFFRNARLDMVEFYENRGMWTEAYEQLQILNRFHSDMRVRDKLARYEWEIARGNMTIGRPITHVYNGVVFIESDYLNLDSIYQSLFLDYSKFFGKFKFTGGDFRKTRSVRDRLALLRSEGHDFFIRGVVSRRRDSIRFEVVDRNNATVAENVFPFSESRMGENAWRVVNWLDDVLPTFYSMKRVVTRRRYVIAAGALQQVRVGEEWVGFSPRSLEPVLRVRVRSVSKSESEVEALPQGSNLDYEEKEGLYFVREKDFRQKDLTKLKFILGY